MSKNKARNRSNTLGKNQVQTNAEKNTVKSITTPGVAVVEPEPTRQQRRSMTNWANEAILILVGFCMLFGDYGFVYDKVFVAIGFISLLLKLCCTSPVRSFVVWVLYKKRMTVLLFAIAIISILILSVLQSIELYSSIPKATLMPGQYQVAIIIVSIKVVQNIFATLTFFCYVAHAQKMETQFKLVGKVNWDRFSNLLFLLLQTIIAYAIFVHNPQRSGNALHYFELFYFILLFFAIEIFVIFGFGAVPLIDKKEKLFSASSIIPSRAILWLALFFSSIFVDDLLQGNTISKQVLIAFILSMGAYMFIYKHIRDNFSYEITQQKNAKYKIEIIGLSFFTLAAVFPLFFETKLPKSFPTFSFDIYLRGSNVGVSSRELLHPAFIIYLVLSVCATVFIAYKDIIRDFYHSHKSKNST